MNLAIIPARGGSKRIPKKNIVNFAGKPLIARAIEVAKRSDIFERVIVSTDDVEVANVAIEFGADVPFMRPSFLADDFTPTAPVIEHAIRECHAYGWPVKYACCIYPCTPFLLEDDLKKAFELIVQRDVDFVYSVTEYPHPIQRAMRQLSTGKMEFFSPQFELTRTQDLEICYHDAGQFYWGKSTAWLSGKKMHTDGIALQIPNWRAIDIDTQDDLDRASFLGSSMELGLL